MNALFNACVVLLQVVAHLTGYSYNEVNVIFFVFIMPAVFLALALSNICLCWYIFMLRRKHKKMKEHIGNTVLHMRPKSVDEPKTEDYLKRKAPVDVYDTDFL